MAEKAWRQHPAWALYGRRASSRESPRRGGARGWTIAGAELDVGFREGETIWTESSRKFAPEELVQMAADGGFRCDTQWIDQEWPFAENLFIAD